MLNLFQKNNMNSNPLQIIFIPTFIFIIFALYLVFLVVGLTKEMMKYKHIKKRC